MVPPGTDRTPDRLSTKQVLYRLSYRGDAAYDYAASVLVPYIAKGRSGPDRLLVVGGDRSHNPTLHRDSSPAIALDHQHGWGLTGML